MRAQLVGFYWKCMLTTSLIFGTAFELTDRSTEVVPYNKITTAIMKSEGNLETIFKSFTPLQQQQPTTEPSSVKSSTQTINFSLSKKHWTKYEDLPMKHRNTENKMYRSKHHHEHHWGPFFEEPLNSSEGALQLVAYVDTEAVLNCRVGMLRDKIVMWVRRTAEKVSLLTVGNVTHSGDPRIKVKFQYPNNWRLLICPVQKDDASLYMCQVSTHPPRVFATNLTVSERPIRFTDEKGRQVQDRFYKADSTIDLTCQISKQFLISQMKNLIKNSNKNSTTTNIKNEFSSSSSEPSLRQFINWKKNGIALSGNVIKNMSNSTNAEWYSSRIMIPKATFDDGGLYSCSIGKIYEVTVHVQVLIGELPAAVQHNSEQQNNIFHPLFAVILLKWFQILGHISFVI